MLRADGVAVAGFLIRVLRERGGLTPGRPKHSWPAWLAQVGVGATRKGPPTRSSSVGGDRRGGVGAPAGR